MTFVVIAAILGTDGFARPAFGQVPQGDVT